MNAAPPKVPPTIAPILKFPEPSLDEPDSCVGVDELEALDDGGGMLNGRVDVLPVLSVDDGLADVVLRSSAGLST